MNLSKWLYRNKSPAVNNFPAVRFYTAFVLCVLAAGAQAAVQAAVQAVDDSGRSVRLPQAAQRVISLAPHITELLFEVGAGELVVGTVEFSNYPPAAKTIPRIGRHNALDLETIVTLKPDIVFAWKSGNPVHPVEKILELGIPVFYSDPRRLLDVARNLHQLGRLTGRDAAADEARRRFESRYQQLQRQYQDKPKVRVFYEIWNQPMMTVNGNHIINEVIELCGGVNVFKSLAPLTPTVDIEAVLVADPEVIIASGEDDAPPPWLNEWQAWPRLSAVRNAQVHHIDPDYIHRQTSRILIGVERVCALLDGARQR